VIATLMVAVMYLEIRGFERNAPPWGALLAGAAIGLLSFFTYAVSFLTLFGVLYAARQGEARMVLRRLGAAALGGVAALAVLRLALGFDLWASYRAGYEVLLGFPGRRLYWYWLFGSVAAWLTFAGLPIAALGARELVRRRPWYLLSVLIPLACFYILPERVSHIIPGELERTLEFVYPFAAIAAAAWFVRWEKHRGAQSPTWAARLVAIAALQTVLIEAVYRMFW
jgi:hypothetical protein